MTVYIKELKQSFVSWLIWTCSIAFMLLVCVMMFPQMKSQMNSITDVFANMGGFTQAFGMDQLSFGELMGFYGVECGNVLGMGGGFFAALAGVTVLANEEKEHTAEFLLTNPVSRFSVITQKLFAVVTQIVFMNLIILLISLMSIYIIGEKPDMPEFLLLHIAYLILQLEIGCICFGISAFIRRGGIGIGLGTALLLYFLNIIKNISESAEFLKYITPYSYADASEIISEAKLEINLILIGAVIALAGIAAGYIKYIKKDIAT